MNLLLAQHPERTEEFAVAYLSGSFGRPGVYASVDYGQSKSENRDRFMKDEKGKNRMFATRVAFLHYMLEQGWEFVSAGSEKEDTTWPSILLFRRKLQPGYNHTDSLKN